MGRGQTLALGSGAQARPVSPHASQGGSWCSPWFLGEVGPSRGTGREARQPSQQALLGWRDQLWIWFSQNTKPPTWSLSPRHWGLCQACAHPLRLCQGGGWAGRRAPAAPAGLSGRGPILPLKPPPPRPQPAFQEQSCSGSEGTCTREKRLCGREPSPRGSHQGSPKHVSMLCPCSWSEQIGASWCPNQEVSFELTFIKYLLCAGPWASAAKYLALAGFNLPRVPQFLR